MDNSDSTSVNNSELNTMGGLLSSNDTVSQNTVQEETNLTNQNNEVIEPTENASEAKTETTDTVDSFTNELNTQDINLIMMGNQIEGTSATIETAIQESVDKNVSDSEDIVEDLWLESSAQQLKVETDEDFEVIVKSLETAIVETERYDIDTVIPDKPIASTSLATDDIVKTLESAIVDSENCDSDPMINSDSLFSNLSQEPVSSTSTLTLSEMAEQGEKIMLGDNMEISDNITEELEAETTKYQARRSPTTEQCLENLISTSVETNEFSTITGDIPECEVYDEQSSLFDSEVAIPETVIVNANQPSLLEIQEANMICDITEELNRELLKDLPKDVSLESAITENLVTDTETTNLQTADELELLESSSELLEITENKLLSTETPEESLQIEDINTLLTTDEIFASETKTINEENNKDNEASVSTSPVFEKKSSEKLQPEPVDSTICVNKTDNDENLVQEKKNPQTTSDNLQDSTPISTEESENACNISKTDQNKKNDSGVIPEITETEPDTLSESFIEIVTKVRKEENKIEDITSTSNEEILEKESSREESKNAESKEQEDNISSVSQSDTSIIEDVFVKYDVTEPVIDDKSETISTVKEKEAGNPNLEIIATERANTPDNQNKKHLLEMDTKEQSPPKKVKLIREKLSAKLKSAVLTTTVKSSKDKDTAREEPVQVSTEVKDKTSTSVIDRMDNSFGPKVSEKVEKLALKSEISGEIEKSSVVIDTSVEKEYIEEKPTPKIGQRLKLSRNYDRPKPQISVARKEQVVEPPKVTEKVKAIVEKLQKTEEVAEKIATEDVTKEPIPVTEMLFEKISTDTSSATVEKLPEKAKTGAEKIIPEDVNKELLPVTEKLKEKMEAEPEKVTEKKVVKDNKEVFSPVFEEIQETMDTLNVTETDDANEESNLPAIDVKENPNVDSPKLISEEVNKKKHLPVTEILNTEMREAGIENKEPTGFISEKSQYINTSGEQQSSKLITNEPIVDTNIETVNENNDKVEILAEKVIEEAVSIIPVEAKLLESKEDKMISKTIIESKEESSVMSVDVNQEEIINEPEVNSSDVFDESKNRVDEIVNLFVCSESSLHDKKETVDTALTSAVVKKSVQQTVAVTDKPETVETIDETDKLLINNDNKVEELSVDLREESIMKLEEVVESEESRIEIPIEKNKVQSDGKTETEITEYINDETKTDTPTEETLDLNSKPKVSKQAKAIEIAVEQSIQSDGKMETEVTESVGSKTKINKPMKETLDLNTKPESKPGISRHTKIGHTNQEQILAAIESIMVREEYMNEEIPNSIQQNEDEVSEEISMNESQEKKNKQTVSQENKDNDVKQTKKVQEVEAEINKILEKEPQVVTDSIKETVRQAPVNIPQEVNESPEKVVIKSKALVEPEVVSTKVSSSENLLKVIDVKKLQHRTVIPEPPVQSVVTKPLMVEVDDLDNLEQDTEIIEQKQENFPRIVIKPIVKPEEQRSSPKITIKPIIKPSERADSPKTHKSQKSSEDMCTPKITIKPIKLDPLKITITKQKSADTHSILKIYKADEHTSPEEQCVPKLTIKPIPKDELHHSPRITIKPVKPPQQQTNSSISPKVTVKPVVSPSEQVEITHSPKITIKPVINPEENYPKVTIKPILRPEDTQKMTSQLSPRQMKLKSMTFDSSSGVTMEPISITPTHSPIPRTSESPLSPLRISVKPFAKMEESLSPKLTIKPITKTCEIVQSEDGISSPLKLTIKPILKPEESYQSPKITIKPIIKPEEEEPDKPERIILKIQKTNLPSPKERTSMHIKETKKEPEVKIEAVSHDPDRNQKLDKIKLKLTKEGGHAQIISSPSTSSDHSYLKRSLTLSDSGLLEKRSKTEISGTEILHTSDISINIVEPNSKPCPKQITEEVTIVKIDKSSKTPASNSKTSLAEHISQTRFKEMLLKIQQKPDITCTSHASHTSLPREDSSSSDDVKIVEVINNDPLKDPLSLNEECYSQDVMIVNQVINTNPFHNVQFISTAATNITDPIVQTPKKRGRPRKNPLEVKPEIKGEDCVEVVRPKRTCRAPPGRTPFVVKERKPRGAGRARGASRGRGAKSPPKPPKEPKSPRGKALKEAKALAKIEAAKLAQEIVIDEITIEDSTNDTPAATPVPPAEDSPAPAKSPEVKEPEVKEAELEPEPEMQMSVEPIVQMEAEPIIVPEEVLKEPQPPPVAGYEEETRMSAENNNSRAQTPARQVVALPSEGPEESQSSVQSTATTESNKNKKGRMEVCDPDSAVTTVEQIVEYSWGNGGPYMLQEQIAQYLGVKSFKRKYPGLIRRPVEMQERDYIREKGLVSESMCDMGLTAVPSSEILDIMYTDFQDKYEEYRKYMRDKQSKEISNKQKAISLATSQEKNKLDFKERAIRSAASWNTNFNKTRKDSRRCCMDLQTFTINFPVGKTQGKAPTKNPVGHYPVALVPGQFTDYYKSYTSSELHYLPLNTVRYGPVLPNQHCEDGGQSEGSQSESDSSSESDSDSSDDSMSTVDDMPPTHSRSLMNTPKSRVH